MANIDKVSVKNTVYNIVSPAVVSDYIEVIGGACTKPDGYVEDEVILAKQNDVQLLFKATQDIAFGANIVENTNCVRTTLEEVLKNAGGGGGASSADQVSYDNSDSGLEAENVQEAVDELATKAGTASSQIQTLTNYANSQSNPNLLDNPFFTVNQRGFTSGAVTSETYPVDRWKFSNNDPNITVSSGTNGLSIVGTPTNTGENLIKQLIEYDRIPNSVGKVITLSVMLADGTVYKSSHVLVSPTSSWQLQAGLDCGTFQVHLLTYGTTPSVFQLFIKSTNEAINVTIRAIKLELGSVSTLAQDTAPNYATELLKCQRYFQRLNKVGDGTPAPIGFGYAAYDVEGRIAIPLSVAMRATPIISADNISHVKLAISSGEIAVSSLQVLDIMNNIAFVKAVMTGATQYEQCSLLLQTQNAFIDFSADL